MVAEDVKELGRLCIVEFFPISQWTDGNHSIKWKAILIANNVYFHTEALYKKVKIFHRHVLYPIPLPILGFQNNVIFLTASYAFIWCLKSNEVGYLVLNSHSVFLELYLNRETAIIWLICGHLINIALYELWISHKATLGLRPNSYFDGFSL